MERLLSLLMPALMVAAPVAMELADGTAPDVVLPEPGGATAAATVSADAPDMEIYVIDVGQGDSTLVIGPEVNGHRVTLLVDGGDMRPAVNGAAMVRTVLEHANVTALDYVVVSHFDSDHMGGFVTEQPHHDSLIWTTAGSNDDQQCTPTELFPTVAIVDSGNPGGGTASRRQWSRCLEQILPDFPGTEHVRVTGGAHIDRVLDLGGGYTARIVSGGGHVIGSDGRLPDVNTPNERTVALLVSSAQGFDMLINGDLIGQAPADDPDSREDAALEGALGAELTRRGIDVEVLRIGHHGAPNASNRQFLQDINAEVAVISVGDNGHGHPHCDTYEALAAAPATQLLLQTELGAPGCDPPDDLVRVVANGTILLSVSESRYDISTVGPNSPVTGEATLDFQRSCSPQGCAATADEPAPASPQCCKICRTSRPCGDSCIRADRICHRSPGCACAGS